jgi:hypothetical protein
MMLVDYSWFVGNSWTAGQESGCTWGGTWTVSVCWGHLGGTRGAICRQGGAQDDMFWQASWGSH